MFFFFIPDKEQEKGIPKVPVVNFSRVKHLQEFLVRPDVPNLNMNETVCCCFCLVRCFFSIIICTHKNYNHQGYTYFRCDIPGGN